MHLIEHFWNHLRTSDSDQITTTIFAGWMVIMVVGLIVLLVWGLVDWLGILVILVPLVLVAAFLVVYGIGYAVVKFANRHY